MTHSSDPTTLHNLCASRSNRIKAPQAWSALKMYVYLPPSVRLAKLQIFLRIDVTSLTEYGTVKLR